ncbi:MAG TPA: chromate transporter, partial [Dehalococcoidia bacterium]|nr:chromate transporter [Dehalococcoidia bacterium]
RRGLGRGRSAAAERGEPAATAVSGLLPLGLGLHFRPATLAAGVATATAAGAAGYRRATLFLTFLKLGSVIYGSGYVLLAFPCDDFVTHLHWLTSPQLIDAVAVGQFTPEPVFTTATFIGYLTGGWAGGLVATVVIFLPAFVFSAIVLRLVPLAKRALIVRAALDGVNAAAVGLMAAVTLQLGKAAVVDVPTALNGLVALALLYRFRWNSAWFVLGGAAAGLAVRAIQPAPFLAIPRCRASAAAGAGGQSSAPTLGMSAFRLGVADVFA